MLTNSFESYETQKNAKEAAQFSFSVFQVTFLVVDKYLRMKINSLHQFLHEIKESTLQFTKKKMSQNDKTDVSMPFYEFQQLYSGFCSKYGFNELQNLETDGARVFEEFSLKIETFEDKLEPAYINIRFKTLKEKQAVKEDGGGSGGAKGKKVGSVQLFLQKECAYSQFESDHIAFEQLKFTYLLFCKNMGIVDS